MKRFFWLILFFLAVAGDMVTLQWQDDVWRTIFKPLLIPLLLIYFLYSTKAVPSPLKKWIVFALLFSWAGDVLLIFEGRDSIFFLLGLSAFLLAHIFYIIFFHFLRIRDGIPGKAWLLIAVVIYYGALISILSPHLGAMKLPVRIYGVVISFMLMLALHMLFIKNKRAGWLLAAGAVLFVASDSMLAINKFMVPFDGAAVLIMLSYAFAQFCIVQGATNYIAEADKNQPAKDL
jgi:uncharacterized membrane protein YhhN